MQHSNRLRAVAISFPLLEMMMEEGYVCPAGVVCAKGLPKGAELVYSFTDYARGEGYLVFSHPSFDEAPEEEIIPRMVVEHTAKG
jgi:hypothetical protein